VVWCWPAFVTRPGLGSSPGLDKPGEGGQKAAHLSVGRIARVRHGGPVAQLVEHETFNLGVQGSNPCGPTKDPQLNQRIRQPTKILPVLHFARSYAGPTVLARQRPHLACPLPSLGGRSASCRRSTWSRANRPVMAPKPADGGSVEVSSRAAVVTPGAVDFGLYVLIDVRPGAAITPAIAGRCARSWLLDEVSAYLTEPREGERAARPKTLTRPLGAGSKYAAACRRNRRRRRACPRVGRR
jgi:hypothetical protein